MTTMTEPVSLTRRPVERPFAAHAAAHSTGTPRFARFVTAFGVSVVWSFFTLLGMSTAVDWATDRYLLPQLSAAKLTEINAPVSGIQAQFEEEAVEAMTETALTGAAAK